MIIHDVIQGSEAWRKLREDHHTASEASAMLGLSKYQSRNDLLKQKATGIAEEITPAKQKIFDQGHTAEAMARPLAEEIIGSELFPCTASSCEYEGVLSSFDGVDMMETIVWEHKLFNNALATAITSNEVPDTHWPQLEQQLLVSGADKAMLMCSDGTSENMAYTWYTSIPERRQQLIYGWSQFNKDLADYEHKEIAIDATGTAPDALPSLHIEVKGMVTASNLNEFKANAMTVIGGIKTDLKTDGDFADADKTAKWLKGVEDKLEQAKEAALSQTADIDAMFKTIDTIKEEARSKRLDLGKKVKSQKENIKSKIVLDAKTKLSEFIEGINKLLDYGLPPIAADFAGAIKGKRTIESLHNAVDTELANAKIEANNIADRIRTSCALIDSLSGDYKFLFADGEQLVLKQEDDLKAVIASRIASHKEQEEKRKADEAMPKQDGQPIIEPVYTSRTPKQEPVRAPIPASPDIDITLRKCANVGWLPIINLGGAEIYRGKHHKSASDALSKADEFLALHLIGDA